MLNSARPPYCSGKLLRLGILTGSLVLGLSQTVSAQTCLQEEYNTVQKQKLNCTANDVSVAGVSGVTDLGGGQLTTCIEGTTFSFIANFQIVTTANATNAGGRDNIGLYFQTDPSKATALSGSCVDNIISKSHACSSDPATGSCGVTQASFYQENDPLPDNCGDTSSSVNGNILDRILVSNFVCTTANSVPCPNDPSKKCLTMPNCTSWQVPGSSNLCVSDPNTGWPYPAPPAAIPGSPSKCNCQVLTLPITPVTPQVIVQKACTTDQTAGPATFTQSPTVTQSPTSCNVGNGTTTESGIATYTVAVTNTTGSSGITIDQICDDKYGTVYRSASYTGSACPTTGTIGTIASFGGCNGTGSGGSFDIPASGATTALCTFTAGPQSESTTVSDTASVTGHADLNVTRTFGPTFSNSVSVTSTELPSTATVSKTAGATIAACATVTYDVEVDNSSAADEQETLSVLTDSAFGSITSVHDSVLRTDCSVPQTISVGGKYTCTFDAQFCSAVDASTCISHNNQVTATVKGDETADPTFTKASKLLTVKECLTPSSSLQ